MAFRIHPRLLLAAAALLVAAAAWPSLHRPTRQTPEGQPTAAGQVAFWLARTEANPGALMDFLYLGEAYHRRARETGAVDDYARAEAATRRALAISPGYPPATVQLAGVLSSLHDFEGALALAEPLTRTNRVAGAALGVVGDAQLALGRYPEAEAAVEQMARWYGGANTAVLTRRAILAEARGDLAAAQALLTEAAELAWQHGELRSSLAWYDAQLGELYFKQGQLTHAEARYRTALITFADYVPALAGLGKVAAARADYPAAIGFYQRASAIVPQPELLAALGDVYLLAGEPVLAEQQYATVEAIGRLAEANQQVYNRQLATFFADRDRQVARALAYAMAELETRRDAAGYDAAAWAAYKNGHLADAQMWIQQALATGAREARFFYHAGLIADAQGQTAEARRWLSTALALNPYFDPLQAPHARAALARLQTALR